MGLNSKQNLLQDIAKPGESGKMLIELNQDSWTEALVTFILCTMPEAVVFSGAQMPRVLAAAMLAVVVLPVRR